MPIKVVISWAAGAWKSTIIQEIVKKLGYETADIWQVFRARAIAKELTIAEYDKLVEQHPEEDRELENEFKETVEWSEKDIIVSWRMWFHCLPKIFSIRLDVEPEEGARRVFKQDRGEQEKKYNSVEEALQANQNRMKRLQERLLKVYDVDFMDKTNYDKIISTDWQTLEENVEAVISAIQEHEKTLK